jgi:peptidyl-tRNA hydrolase
MSVKAFRERIVTHPWSDAPSDDGSDPYALIIIVKEVKDPSTGRETIPEHHYIHAASEAFLELLSEYGDDRQVTDRLDHWMASRIRKLVKRAKPSKFEAINNDAEIAHTSADYHGANVLVFAPMRFSEQPHSVHRLQVSGLKAPEWYQEEHTDAPHLDVTLNESLSMTTGKRIAQYLHAVQIAFQNLDDSDFLSWKDHGFTTTYHMGTPSADEEVVIHDAGFTEVEANAFTASASLVV